MSSVPLPAPPSLSSTQPGPEPHAVSSSQDTETNTQFSTVLEGEQAALDAENRDSSQDLNAKNEDKALPETPVVVDSADSDGKPLPLIAELAGIVVAEAPPEKAAPVVLEEGEGLKTQGAVMPSSGVGATLNRLMTSAQSGVQERPGVTVAKLLQPGVAASAVPVDEVAKAAAEPLNSLSAAVHRAVQSEMLPVQAAISGMGSSELLSAPLTTAQFAAVQALNEGPSASAASMQTAPLTVTVNTGSTAIATNSGLPGTTLDVPFRQTGWDGALGERVVWMVNQKLQAAEIKLNPPQLGPIEVRINVHNDQAQVTFTAQHANVREALEAAIPRLREMFGSTGLDLVDVGVSQQSFSQREGAESRTTSALAESAADALPELDDSLTTAIDQSDPGSGVIDLFA